MFKLEEYSLKDIKEERKKINILIGEEEFKLKVKGITKREITNIKHNLKLLKINLKLLDIKI